MKNFFYTIHQNKIWFIAATLAFCGLFWVGYHQVIRVNKPLEAPKQELAPLKIPREYSAPDSLLDLKMERDRQRSRETVRVQEIIEKIGLSDEVRKQAESELWRLNQVTSKEYAVENLLQAKGYPEALVTINTNLVTVVVKGKYKATEIGSIGQAAAEVTGYNLEQIEIVER